MNTILAVDKKKLGHQRESDDVFVGLHRGNEGDEEFGKCKEWILEARKQASYERDETGTYHAVRRKSWRLKRKKRNETK